MSPEHKPDLQLHEQTALTYGGAAGGQYLDSIGKTDLATLTSDEWQTFLQVVCFEYHRVHNELMPCPF